LKLKRATEAVEKLNLDCLIYGINRIKVEEYQGTAKSEIAQLASLIEQIEEESKKSKAENRSTEDLSVRPEISFLDEISLKDGPHPVFKSASSSVTLKYSEDAGRYMVANRQIDPGIERYFEIQLNRLFNSSFSGDVLLIEKAFVTSLMIPC
jgi:hypothetical protein